MIDLIAHGARVTGNPQLSAKRPQSRNCSGVPFSANPQYPQPVSFAEKRQLHLDPDWITARDNWHRHYFRCKACQIYHRGHKSRPPNNPCLAGSKLYQQYRQASE